MNDLRACDGLNGDDDDPEIPIEPARQEPRQMAKASAREIGEGLHAVNRNRHFGQHPHDEQDDEPGNRKGENRGWPRLTDRGR